MDRPRQFTVLNVANGIRDSIEIVGSQFVCIYAELPREPLLGKVLRQWSAIRSPIRLPIPV
jgi:hypothetical protein